MLATVIDSATAEGSTVKTAHRIATEEVAAGILTLTETEDCGCPVYRVAQGKVSDFIGRDDLLMIGRRDCKLPAHNRTLL